MSAVATLSLHKGAELFIVCLPEGETTRKARAESHGIYIARKPVTFLALQCDMEAAKKIIKPDFERFRWAPCMLAVPACLGYASVRLGR